MGLDQAISGMCIILDGLLSRVFSPHIAAASHGIRGKEIPKPAYAVIGSRSIIIEVRMCKVEAYVLHPHQHPLACESLWQALAQMSPCPAHEHCSGVHMYAVALSSLNAHHFGLQ